VDATVTGSGPTWRLTWGAAGSGYARAFGAAMREAGILLPCSPLAACHVCLATSTDDVDEMIAAAARVRRAHVTGPQEVTMTAPSDRFPTVAPACPGHGSAILDPGIYRYLPHMRDDYGG
jgi:hypothetical protein